MLHRVSHGHRGQAVVEYILLTALTVLATVAVFRAFRADIATAYRKAGQTLISSVDDSAASNSASSPVAGVE